MSKTFDEKLVAYLGRNKVENYLAAYKVDGELKIVAQMPRNEVAALIADIMLQDEIIKQAVDQIYTAIKQHGTGK